MDGSNIISTAIVRSEHCLKSLIICLLVSFVSYVIFLIIFGYIAIYEHDNIKWKAPTKYKMKKKIKKKLGKKDKKRTNANLPILK